MSSSASVHPSVLPGDVWASFILPLLAPQDFLRLLASGSEWRTYFCGERFRPLWQRLGFSEYDTVGQLLDFVEGVGVHLEALAFESDRYRGCAGYRTPCGSHMQNVTKNVPVALKFLAHHPRSRVAELSVDSAYLSFGDFADPGQFKYNDIYREHLIAGNPPHSFPHLGG